jgi:hypothetical protein
MTDNVFFIDNLKLRMPVDPSYATATGLYNVYIDQTATALYNVIEPATAFATGIWGIFQDASEMTGVYNIQHPNYAYILINVFSPSTTNSWYSNNGGNY